MEVHQANGGVESWQITVIVSPGGGFRSCYFTLGLQPPPEKVVGVGLGGLTTF